MLPIIDGPFKRIYVVAFLKTAHIVCCFNSGYKTWSPDGFQQLQLCSSCIVQHLRFSGALTYLHPSGGGVMLGFVCFKVGSHATQITNQHVMIICVVQYLQSLLISVSRRGVS